MFVHVLDWNHANLKRLNDMEIIKAMLSPHTSPSFMRQLEERFRQRQPPVLEADSIEHGCTIEVDCEFREPEEPSFSYVAELLKEAY